jgi:glycosyltransferase involved in cell wall biosynthesis
MRILFFMGVYLPRPGGVPRNTHRLVSALRKTGVDVEVLAPHEEGDQDLSLSYPVQRYSRWPVKRVLTRAYLLWLLKIYNQKPFDIIHCHGIDPAAYVSSFFKVLKGVPYIVTPRRTNIFKEERHLLHRYRNRRARRGLLLADMVTALSSEIQKIVESAGVESKRIVRIPHGIDQSPFCGVKPIERTRPYVLALGRLVRFKGFDCLIRAFSYLADRRREIDLVIIGDGPMHEELQELASGLGLSDRVHLVGRKEGEEKLAWYRGASAFVLPSYPGNEGFPNVLLEAMAANLPIVATSVSGAEDVVIHGKTGYLVPPHDSNALADGIDLILTPTGAISPTAISALLGKYRLDAIADRYRELYKEVIRKHGIEHTG